MGLEIVLLSDAVGPHALHQRVFAYDRAARLDQRYQYIEGACAELERPAVGEQLAALRQHPEAPELHARCWFGGGIHQAIIGEATGNLGFFQIGWQAEHPSVRAKEFFRFIYPVSKE